MKMNTFGLKNPFLGFWLLASTHFFGFSTGELDVVVNKKFLRSESFCSIVWMNHTKITKQITECLRILAGCQTMQIRWQMNHKGIRSFFPVILQKWSDFPEIRDKLLKDEFLLILILKSMKWWDFLLTKNLKQKKTYEKKHADEISWACSEILSQSGSLFWLKRKFVA